MKTIVLISACKTKCGVKGLAKELYQGQFTAKAYRYAKSLNPDKIYFLSPKYGLVDPLDEIKTVNFTFDDLSSEERKKWNGNILTQLKNNGINLEEDKFLFLAYKTYWKGLAPTIKNKEAPLDHLRQGEQIGWLTDRLKSTDQQ